jgi:hypothetical protein
MDDRLDKVDQNILAVLIRITALENILVSKGVITSSEILAEMQKITKAVTDQISK